MVMFKMIWIFLLTIFFGGVGAVWLGDFTSLPMSILGGLLGGVCGWLLGKYIPVYEWFI